MKYFEVKARSIYTGGVAYTTTISADSIEEAEEYIEEEAEDDLWYEIVEK